MTDARTSSVLQTASHILVVGAGLVYLFGFVIVSIFDSTYGIVDFSLFRTKVIAVGIVFMILVALAMVLTFRMFHFFGLIVERSVSVVQVTPENETLVMIDVALFFPIACFGLTAPFTVWLGAAPIWVGRGFSLFLILLILIPILGIASTKWFNAHPWLFIFLPSLHTSAFPVILFKYSYRAVFWVVVWLSLVCVFTLYLSLRLSKSDEARKTEWERLLLVMLPAIFGLYATKVYSNIPHHLGGGKPVPIVLHLTKSLPVFNTDSASVSLIDETEQGYYVLYQSDKAVFVARSLVEEVEFLHSGPALEGKASKPKRV